MAERTCSIDGCEKPAKGRGWCGMHYQRWIRHGAVELLVKIQVACAVDGCENAAETRGWCIMHYNRWWKHGDLGTAERQRRENTLTCTVEGCTEPHRAKGKCAKHYYEDYKPKVFIACSIDGCSEPVRGRGWCRKHWQRWRKYGDPLTVAQIKNDDEVRFWSYVDKNGPIPARRPDLGPCWLWTAKTGRAGYGRFTVGYREVSATRWICELKLGSIPEGYEPDHLCFNTSCVNYESHLEVVTRRENTLRGGSPPAINARKTHCDNGHEFTPENTYIRTRPRGGRACRICRNDAARRYREKKRAA